MEVWILIGGAVVALNTMYWIFIMIGIRRVPHRTIDAKNAEEITLIVVCHNALDQIQSHLSSWLRQRTSSTEVWIVDDGSTDGTASWVQKQQKIHASLKYLYHDKKSAGKKAALAMALDLVKTRWVILTDADCQPNSDTWIAQALAHARNQQAEVLLMYGPYLRRTGWLNKLFRFENVLTAWQYFAFWAIGRPYMCVGRNVLYHETVYRRFSKNSQREFMSGDDDLFFQKISDQHPVGATLNPETLLYSEAPDTLGQWFHQKARHASASMGYPWLFQLILGLFAATQIVSSFYIITFLISFHWLLFICIMGRWLSFLIWGKKSLSRLQQEDLYPYWIVLDIIFGVMLLVLATFSFFRTNRNW